MKTNFEVWTGHDTFGRMVEVARRVGEDKWFARYMQQSQYGMAFSKWQPHTPVWKDIVPAPEMSPNQSPIKVPPFIAWGFQPLHLVEGGKARLPKV